MGKSHVIDKTLLISCLILLVCCVASIYMVFEYKERESQRVKELIKINNEIVSLRHEYEMRMLLLNRP